jgi:hypothetical protein
LAFVFFLFDEPLKGSKSLKKISLTFCFDKLRHLSKSVHTGENSQILTVSNKKIYLILNFTSYRVLFGNHLGRFSRRFCNKWGVKNKVVKAGGSKVWGEVAAMYNKSMSFCRIAHISCRFLPFIMESHNAFPLSNPFSCWGL